MSQAASYIALVDSAPFRIAPMSDTDSVDSSGAPGTRMGMAQERSFRVVLGSASPGTGGSARRHEPDQG